MIHPEINVRLNFIWTLFLYKLIKVKKQCFQEGSLLKTLLSDYFPLFHFWERSRGEGRTLTNELSQLLNSE
jgi:hypothetical protein